MACVKAVRKPRSACLCVSFRLHGVGAHPPCSQGDWGAWTAQLEQGASSTRLGRACFVLHPCSICSAPLAFVLSLSRSMLARFGPCHGGTTSTFCCSGTGWDRCLGGACLCTATWRTGFVRGLTPRPHSLAQAEQRGTMRPLGPEEMREAAALRRLDRLGKLGTVERGCGATGRQAFTPFLRLDGP